jgi:hypothetical protein
MTCDGFDFVPKPMPIELTGTHVSPVGTKPNNKIVLYVYVCSQFSKKEKNHICVYLHNVKHMHATLM